MKLICKMQLRGINVTVSSLAMTMLVATNAMGEFPSENVTLLSQVLAAQFPGSPSRGNDCWGYVSESGREYALMGMRNGMAVVEVTDPSFPVIIQSISHTESNWSDVKTYQHYAYVVNEQLGGMDVIDLSDVDNGIVTLVQRVTDAGLLTSHNVAIDTDSGYLYLCGSNINSGRLIAFSLADPADPTLVGQLPSNQGHDVHDAQIVTYTKGPYAGKQVAFAAVGDFGLEIYDVTVKSNLFKIGQATYPNIGFSHQCWLSGDRQYLYLNDEIDGINETVVFDVSDPAAPSLAGTYTAGIKSIDHNLYWHEGFIYEADYTGGLRIFDATEDPVNPVQVGWFDTVPGTDALEFFGAWSVYPFFPSGNVIISTKYAGMFVVRPGPAPIVFQFPNGVPTQINPAGESFLVEIFTQDGEELDISSPTLHYNFGEGYIEAPMKFLGKDIFEAAFAPTPCGQPVQFYVSARTVTNITLTEPLGAPVAFFDAVSANDSAITFQDQMESDLGWIVGAPDDDATEGIWVRVEPYGTIAQPEADHTPDPGELCYVTGQGNPNGGAGDADVDEGQTTLISPLFDLTGEEDAVITYWRWYSNDFFLIDHDEGNAPNEDIFVIDITNDNGKTWTNLETIGPTGPGTSGGWIYHAFNVGNFVEPTAEVRLRFIASDLIGFSIVEAAVDDVQVTTIVCNKPIPGDIDGDGSVGVKDLLILLGSWGPCADCNVCPADLDGDCSVGVKDLLILLGNWG